MPRELPIFPLPLVLFPGARQPLHIFEPRYRRLVADCLRGDRRFGIVYAAARPEPDPAPEAGSAGCIALIRAAHPFPDGRSTILTEGERRFTLLEWLPHDVPYRVGRVEEFDDDPEDPAELGTLATEVREHFGRLSRAVSAFAVGAEAAHDLPADPVRLSFVVAAALDLEAEAKRALLSTRSTSSRLRRLATLLRVVAQDAERRAVVRRRAQGNGRGRARQRGGAGS
ncbi:MAG TPA: LON peptidase substrate-binding domain-containing protein [Gemmatimonadales bacterium]|nr:LON peptidase substrate-binding domain-containing protein [Gemmatimonadales bacterium]